MSSVIRPGSEPLRRFSLPRPKTVAGLVVVAVGLWLSVLIVRELAAIIADPNASAWLATFNDLPPDARTVTTPSGEYRVPPVFLQSLGLLLLAVFLYCFTNLAVVILRVGGWMLRDDAEEILKKFTQRIEEMKRTATYRIDIEAWSGKQKEESPDFPGAYEFPGMSVPFHPGDEG